MNLILYRISIITAQLSQNCKSIKIDKILKLDVIPLKISFKIFKKLPGKLGKENGIKLNKFTIRLNNAVTINYNSLPHQRFYPYI